MPTFQLYPRLRFPAPGPGNFGPGKADLLAEIDRHGSIRVAAQAMTMSYQRAWNLVNEMNALFREPLVTMSRGGETGGGAALTETGRDVLQRYRRMEKTCREATVEDFAALRKLMRG